MQNSYLLFIAGTLGILATAILNILFTEVLALRPEYLTISFLYPVFIGILLWGTIIHHEDRKA